MSLGDKEVAPLPDALLNALADLLKVVSKFAADNGATNLIGHHWPFGKALDHHDALARDICINA